MSADKQDKVINKLYQQRKSAVIAPQINLDMATPFKEKKFRFTTYVVALLGGGLASFGILAVISHLAQGPVQRNVPENHVNHKGNTVEYKPDKLSDLTIQAVDSAVAKINQGLPVLQKTPQRMNEKVISEDVRFPIIASALLDDNFVLNVKQPMASIALVHKEMPDYPKTAMLAKKSGKVKLSYRVNNRGEVDNIIVLSESGYRPFQKSAIKALSQWQYVVNTQQSNDYEIVFEFIKP